MEVVSVSPLRVSSVLWQKGPASWVLTVICKATYDLSPGESQLADDQEAVNDADAHWNDDSSRSLHAPSDLAPLKMRGDVVLVGSAFAPGGVPARAVTARLLVNKIDKAIECVADRAMGSDGSVQEGSGFTRMSLLYERAAGGVGTVNPVGVRRDARDGYGRTTLPNLQPPGARLAGRDIQIEPVGFGPIPPRWPQRLEKLGRYAASWPPLDWTSGPLPGDLDLGYFNVAPPDQQVTALRDNERIVLENLHMEHPRLVTALAGVRPCAFVEGRAGSPFRLPMHPDTLWIDTDRAACTMTWRRQLPLERPDEPGRVIVAMEMPGQTFTWADVSPLIAARDEKPEIETLIPPPVAPPAPPSEHTAAALRVAQVASSLPFASMDRPIALGQTLPFSVGGAREEGRGGLPFQSAPGPAAAIPGSPWGVPLPQAPVPARPASDPDAGFVPRGPLRTEPDSGAFPLPAAPPPPPPAPVAVPLPPPAASAAVVDSPWAAGGVTPSFVKTAAPVPQLAVASATAEAWPASRLESVRTEASEILELLWFESDSVPRIRRNRAWKPILTALEQRPKDRDLDDPALADEPMEMEDRREVFEILAHGASADASGLDHALEAAVRDDGKFVAQLALFSGQLEFRFDEMETLKATVATVAPFVTPTDENLKTAVQAAKDFLATADELTPPTVSDGMTARIREAFAASKRAVADTHLVEQTDRVLLGQRRYQKRIVFGGAHLRCLVHLGEGVAVPGYLPESLAKKLPLYQRFKGRLIAEVQQQADQYESYHASLRVVALARVTPRRGSAH